MKSDMDTPDAGDFDLQKAFYFLLERKWIILGCMAGAALLGMLYIARTPNTYEATTSIQVEQAENKFVNIEDISQQDLKQAEILKTIEVNFSNSTLLLGVIRSLKLTPEDIGMAPSPDGTPPTDNELVQAFSRMVSAKLVRGTRLINITAENKNPVTAQQIADEIVKEYAHINTAQRAGLSSEANKFLFEEAARLKRQVEVAESEAQAFKDQHPDVALENSQAFIDQKLLALNEKLNQAKEARFKVESDYTQVKLLLRNDHDRETVNKLLTISSVNTDINVSTQQKSLSDAEANLRELAQRYRPKHPQYQQGQAQVASLQEALTRATVQAGQAVGTALEAAKSAEANFDKDLKAMEKAKLDNDKLTIPYEALRREVEANQQLYEAVKTRLRETEVTSAIESNELRVITPAMLPQNPAKPKKSLILAASLLGGLMLGLATGFGMSMTDTSLKSVDNAERVLGLPALAAIPVVEKQPGGKRFLISQDTLSPVAEAFRTLRTSLTLETGDVPTKTILFTSSIPGEGKSFCAMNYAISLAQIGQRTLLIDADMRLPMVGKTMLGKDRGNGLQSALVGESKLDDSVSTIAEVPNLTILPAGTKKSNPAEILAGNAFSELLKEAEGKYDRVVIDSAPVHAVSDTMLLTKHVQTICFVINASETPSKAVERACHLLTNAGTKPVGIVLNRISQAGGGYYYSYTGKYGKVYGATSGDAA